MEGNTDFARFLAGVLGREPSARRQISTEPVPQVRGRRPLTDIEEILNLVVSRQGTQALQRPERTLLLGNPSAIAQRLLRLIDELNLDPRLRSLCSDSKPAELLVRFLLIVLHHRAMKEIIVKHQELRQKYRIAIAFFVLIERLPRNAPERERNELRDKLNRFCNGVLIDRDRMKADVHAIVAKTAGFETTHQLFCHGQIAVDLGLRVDWQYELLDIAAVTISPAQIRQYQTLKYLESQKAQTQERIRFWNEVIRTLTGRPVPVGTQERIRFWNEMIRNLTRRPVPVGVLVWDPESVRNESEQERTYLRNIQREMESLRSELSPYLSLIQGYLERVDRRQYDRQTHERRNALLQEADRLLQEQPTLLTSRRFFVRDSRDSEEENWIRYHRYLEVLIGIGNISLEDIISAFLGDYRKINQNRDIGLGLRAEYSADTYTGHPENALDIHAEEGFAVVALWPTEFVIPPRLLRGSFAGTQPYHYLHQETTVGRARATTDIQDIFAKLAYGLMRCNWLGKTMRHYKDNDPFQGVWNGSSWEHPRFDVPRIISGLTSHNLTEVPIDETHGNLEDLRTRILNDWERLILQQPDLQGIQGVQAGILSIRAVTPAVWRRVLEKAGEILRSRGPGEALVQQIWHLMWQLKRAGADPSCEGQSVTLEHIYRLNGNPQEPAIVVEAFYTHLHRVDMRPGQKLDRPGSSIGTVGQTGNAVDPHLHLAITLRYGGKQAIGTVLPHEFLPLVR